MKTKLLLIILLCVYFNTINAQWINSLAMHPTNPTTNDSIFIYASCTFPSGTCDQHSQTLYISPGYIYGQSTHCLGMLAYICDATDTFKIIPLAAGNYSFVFNLNSGSLPAPCTPGINPGISDTIFFTVTSASGIDENNGVPFSFNIFPNPAKDKLHLLCKDESLLNKNNSLLIYSVTGQQLLKYDITDKEMSVDVSQLSNGIYLCRIAGESLNEKHWIEIVN